MAAMFEGLVERPLVDRAVAEVADGRPGRRRGTSMAKATPAASGMWLPTIAWPPMKPFSASKKCIEPPCPLEQPVTLPSSSAIAALARHPAARAWPWSR